MKHFLLILILSAFSLEAATIYSVKEIKKILDKNDQIDAILLTVTVTIDGDSLDGSTFLLPAARAEVIADPTKYKTHAEKLAAETALRFLRKIAATKEVKLDPTTIVIDPVKVEEEKVKIEIK